MTHDLFALPPDSVLYEALLRRDPAYEGRAFVGVQTTGVFCRLTCPARKPLARNCRFFASVRACFEAGFRPCQRCHPLDPARLDPLVAQLLAELEADPTTRWSEDRIKAQGYDPSTVRRAFRRAFGMTFLDMARARRIKSGVARLGQGAQVIDAQLDAGFDSASGFRAAFARLLGHPPKEMRPRTPQTNEGNTSLYTAWIDTPLGGMIAVTDRRALHLLEFVGRRALAAELRRLSKGVQGQIGLGRTDITDQIEAELGQYFTGQSACFRTPLVRHGTAFERRVWARLQEIPPGETLSYGALARDLGQPGAARAVARANGANQIAIVIPCHRVIGADGTMTGYGGGIWRKEALLAIERDMTARSMPPCTNA